jgi:hypothetical protein
MNNIASDDVVRALLETEGDPYSPEAKARTRDFFTDYSVELLLEAARLAKRDSVQQVSSVHVEEAKKRLRSVERRNWKKKLCGQVGGASLGLGLSTLAPCFVNSSQISISTVIICVVSFLIGTVLLMLDALT